MISRKGGDAMGMRYCYFDTCTDFDFMIEIIENHSVIRGINTLITEGARNWDGKDPYRPIVF